MKDFLKLPSIISIIALIISIAGFYQANYYSDLRAINLGLITNDTTDHLIAKVVLINNGNRFETIAGLSITLDYDKSMLKAKRESDIIIGESTRSRHIGYDEKFYFTLTPGEQKIVTVEKEVTLHTIFATTISELKDAGNLNGTLDTLKISIGLRYSVIDNKGGVNEINTKIANMILADGYISTSKIRKPFYMLK